MKKISLTAPAKDVSFSPEGAFAFVAGGSSSSSVTAWSTCGLSSALTNNVVLPAVPFVPQGACPRRSQSGGPAHGRERHRDHHRSGGGFARDRPLPCGPGAHRLLFDRKQRYGDILQSGPGQLCAHPVDRVARRGPRLRAGQRSRQRAGVQYRQPDVFRYSLCPAMPSRSRPRSPPMEAGSISRPPTARCIFWTPRTAATSSKFPSPPTPRLSRPACAVA